METRHMKVAVIGAGAAGMTAAIAAAEHGALVTLYEHTDRVGKKILATGNGRCNLTNIIQEADCYRGSHPDYAQKILKQFGLQETLQFFSNLGIYCKNKNGGFYPHCEQASAVLDVLRMRLQHLHIQIRLEEKIQHVEKKGNGFLIVAKKSQVFDRVILAAGSRAAESTGSDGSGYELARQLGHTVITPLPALVQLRSDLKQMKALAGVRCDAMLHLMVENKCVCMEEGELQLTDYGISGIPVFQLSGQAARAIHNKQTVYVIIDFMPHFTNNDFLKILKARIQAGPYKTMEELLIGMLHKKINTVLLKTAGISLTQMCNDLSAKQLMVLSQTIKELHVPIIAANSFDKAQTCTGGIDTNELTDMLESRINKGIYFAGEILDIDGRCGGYNLQWAWSSGYVAGKHAATE